ncbi:MAG: hypothetical protein JW965_03795 [Bacteroidales bacterium]|nr:hypothetical protein [Bacteroidales bacterium]
MVKFLTIYLFTFLLHPVHVSMSSMEYIPQDSGYRVTVRMFSDDLLLDLLNLYQLPEEHVADHVYAGPDDIYEDYINEKVQIKINGKQYPARLLETEKLEIETIMRLFVDYDGEINTIDITNTILTTIYLDQVNLFIYKDEENELAFRFTPEYLKEKLNLVKVKEIP